MQGQYLEKQANGAIFLTKVKEGYLVENRDTSIKKLHSSYREAAWLFKIWADNQNRRFCKG